MLRRVKAALVTGVLWALVWIPVGVGVGLYQYWTGSFIDVAPTPARMVAFILMRFALGWGLMGAISGALFAFTLAVAERGRTVATISVGRVAVWGAVRHSHSSFYFIPGASAHVRIAWHVHPVHSDGERLGARSRGRRDDAVVGSPGTRVCD